MPLPAFSGQLGQKGAAHLLRRAAFGGTKQQIDDFASMTATAAVSALYSGTLPDPQLPVNPETGQEWITLPVSEDTNSIDLENWFMGWTIGQMMAVGVNPSVALAYSARERLVYFLHTHFTTIKSRVTNAKALYYQNQLFRLFALDGATTSPDKNFKVLTAKVCVDNAMLRVLDGALNVKGNVNENFAREFHELYTVGRGLEGRIPPTTEKGDYVYYKEADVQAAAKVFSGWDSDITFTTLDPDTNLPRGKVKGSATNATQHNNEPKQFSDRYQPGGVTLTPDATLMQGGNPTEESAMDEIIKLVDLVYANPETARNICRRIYRFFVWGPHTTDEADPIESIITEMVNTFAANNYKLQPLIEELLRSQHFYDAAAGIADDNFGGIIKSPIDLVLGTYRFFEVQLPDMNTSPVEFYAATKDIIGILGNMAMNYYEPFDIAGYEAYWQYPVYHRYWITPNTLATRYEFIQRLFRADEPGLVKADPLKYLRDRFGSIATDQALLVKTLVEYLLPVPDSLTYDRDVDQDMLATITAERMNYFVAHFMGDLGEDPTYWGSSWAGLMSDEELARWCATLFNTILQTPEYQLA